MLYRPDMLFQDFINRIYSSMRGVVPAFTYGVDWLLFNSKTGERILHQGHGERMKVESWEQSRMDDKRTLIEVGISPGDHLVVFPMGHWQRWLNREQRLEIDRMQAPDARG